jgi:scyllo-inositol 2-dehydrogenase (NADP+)
MQALQSGKHVMIEKPMAVDFAQSERIVAEAKRGNRVVSVFHNRRWDIDYLTLKQAFENQVCGRVFNVESRLGQWSSCVGPAASEYRPNWRNEAAFGGGGLFDWGSHFLDQLWQLMLPAIPLRVFAQLRGNVWSSDCDDFARLVVDFDNGAVGMMEINTTTRRPLPRWHVDGTGGTIESPHSLAFDTHIWAELDFIDADKGLPTRLSLAKNGMNEIQMWDRFGSAGQGDGAPAVTAESVLPTMLLLDAARQSSREGRAVECSLSGKLVGKTV